MSLSFSLSLYDCLLSEFKWFVGRAVSRRYWATVFGKEFRALSKCARGLDSCRSPKTHCWNKRAECIKGPFPAERPRGEKRDVCLSFNFINSWSHFSSRERCFSRWRCLELALTPMSSCFCVLCFLVSLPAGKWIINESVSLSLL